MALPRRLYRRLDRARLEPREVAMSLLDIRHLLPALVASHESYRSTGSVVELKRISQQLVDALAEELEVPSKMLFLRDRPRPHRRSEGRIVYEVHGLCAVDGPLEVYTRTAARAQPIALLTYLDTLLHEWVHHWDFHTFGNSVHCTGFFERVGQIYKPVRDLLAEQAARA